MTHPLGESYEIWCDLNACQHCGGVGTVEDEDGYEHDCAACNGSGIDPDAEFVSDDGGK